jgi:hypothetical protein
MYILSVLRINAVFISRMWLSNADFGFEEWESTAG